METTTCLHSNQDQVTKKEETPKHPLNLWTKKQFFFELDYAVREQLKRQLHLQLEQEMDDFVAKGLTYEQLLEVQKELELCPSVLEFYPGRSPLKIKIARWWSKLTNTLSQFF